MGRIDGFHLLRSASFCILKNLLYEYICLFEVNNESTYFGFQKMSEEKFNVNEWLLVQIKIRLFSSSYLEKRNNYQFSVAGLFGRIDEYLIFFLLL